MEGQKKSDTEKKRRLEEAVRVITELSNDNFYGKVIFTFENGHAVHVQTERTIKM